MPSSRLPTYVVRGVRTQTRRRVTMRIGNPSGVCVSILAFFLGPTVCVLNTAASDTPGPSSACPSQYRNAAAQSALDGKTAVALRIQEEHKKAEVSWAVSDFEKCLNSLNASECERRLNNLAELWSGGVRVNSYHDFIEAKRNVDSTVGQKPRLRNEVIEIVYPEAHVTLDTLPDREHHTYLLESVRDKWVVRCFASSPAK